MGKISKIIEFENIIEEMEKEKEREESACHICMKATDRIISELKAKNEILIVENERLLEKEK